MFGLISDNSQSHMQRMHEDVGKGETPFEVCFLSNGRLYDELFETRTPGDLMAKT